MAQSFVLVALAALGWGRAIDPDPGGKAMLRDAASSEIHRHGVIVLLEVRRVEPGPWGPDPENPLNQRRQAAISGLLLEVLQGKVEAGVGGGFAIEVSQRRPVSGFIAEDYGPWSREQLEAGRRLLVFGDRPAPTSDLDDTLERGSRLVIPLPDPTYPSAVEDVRLGVDLKRRDGFPAILGEEAVRVLLKDRCDAFGPIMARFLVDAARDEPGPIDPLIFQLLEASDAPDLFRVELLRYLVEDLSLHDDAPAERRARVIRAMLSILREPMTSTTTLREGIRQAYLRSVALTPEGEPRLKASHVVPDPADRDRDAAFLAGLDLDKDLTKRLAEWIREP